jgi:hypothetical protein
MHGSLQRTAFKTVLTMALGSIQPDTIDELDEGPAPARACSRERAVRIHRDRPSPPEAEWY